ncbi:MAG: hypothetical protein HY910_08765 [Desulfarculus sp.]|nr:hypothetical protein [Desulfarculus sp.]
MKLSAPWGAGVVLGLVQRLYLPEGTSYRGTLRVVQVANEGSLAFVSGLRTLAAKARARQIGFWEEVPMTLLCQRAALGWVDLVSCKNQPRRRRWAWGLANPTRGDERTAMATQAGPTLFERA